MDADHVVEALKKAAYAGVGLVFVTKDKVEEMARKIVEEAKLSEGEGKKFFDDLLRKTEETRHNVEKMVSITVEKTLDRLDLPRRSELKSLESRISSLEEKQTGGTASR